ncbi:MAG: winged helix-turn-helix transcriptional regulator [Peptococcaceae bacterium]|jgi:ATP-dependent DNA helicase RecG|nr:winged helix-turn-helix transcriptional regulator [Peptococcaceae bacterium]
MFRSTEQSFIVTLKNLNYGKTSAPLDENIGVDGVDNGDDTGVEKNGEKIINAISAEPKATQNTLSEITGLSTRTISREIKELRDTGVIKRVGSDRSGYWEIVR